MGSSLRAFGYKDAGVEKNTVVEVLSESRAKREICNVNMCRWAREAGEGVSSSIRSNLALHQQATKVLSTAEAHILRLIFFFSDWSICYGYS